jgi:hypothetical protein
LLNLKFEMLSIAVQDQEPVAAQPLRAPSGVSSGLPDMSIEIRRARQVEFLWNCTRTADRPWRT